MSNITSQAISSDSDHGSVNISADGNNNEPKGAYEMNQTQYYAKMDAASVLGLTYRQFLKLNLKPAKYRKNLPAGWIHLYDVAFIDSLVNNTYVVSLRTVGRMPKNVEWIYY